ncbi:MAG: TRAP transporter small permease [Clostridiales Family XIII bacterium]|jgi:TRAP-type C4-dicarboxylate transport system permease small subunit|nr:TRAP transporter small permease [Clostridiales Family XIII bacterium]
MKKILSFVNKNLEAVLSSFFLVVMTVLIISQIVCRIIGLPLSWTEELARYTFIWLIFISCAYAVKKRVHIKLDLFYLLANRKGKLILSVFSNCAFFFFSAVMMYWTIKSVYKLKEVNYQVSPAIGLPMWIANLALSIGFILMVYRLVEDTALLFKQYKNNESIEGGGALL